MALSSAHPLLIGLIVFASATAEAIIFVGALVPGTAIILAVSGVAGAANLPLWPLILWASAGAALGDGASVLDRTSLRPGSRPALAAFATSRTTRKGHPLL